MQGLKNLLSKLDQTSVTISRTKTYSSNIGKCFGIIFVVFLTLAFIFKIIGMVNKDTIYLNSYYANERSSVSIKDYQYRLVLSDWGTDITVANQFQYGLNVTMAQTIWNYTNLTQSTFDALLQQFDNRITHQNNKDNLSFQLQPLQYTLNIRTFPMMQCPNKGFCTPKQFAQNLTLAGDSYFQDKIQIDYRISVKPCNKSHPKCKPVPPDGYNAFYLFRCKKFDIYEVNTQKVASSCELPTGKLDWIADDQNEQISITYYFKQINITTYQPSFIPSFIPSFMLPNIEKQIFQQFWYYDDQKVEKTYKRRLQSDYYYEVNFRRSRKSQSYERRFIGIDNVLAEVFGISSFVTLLLRIFFNHYAQWEAQCFIAEKVTRDHNYRGSFFKYIKQKFKCCLSDDEKIRIVSRQKVLQGANQNVDIIDASYKIMELEQKIKIYQQIIALQLKDENEDKKRKIIQLIQKKKAQSVIFNLQQKSKSENNLINYVRHSLNQSLIQSQSKRSSH